MKKIVFWNRWHNGDVHVSRGIVRQIINKVKSFYPEMLFSYAHPNSPELLKDIPELMHEPHLLGHIDQHDNLVQINDSLYINTWYAQQNYKYMNQYGMTFDCLYLALNESCQQAFNFSLNEISNDLQDFFPLIDYSYFQIDHVVGWLKAHSNKKVLIENGLALSGQAHNVPLKEMIYQLAIQHPHIDFITSHKEEITLPNVFYTGEIIQKNACDLNEISYLSQFCDLIIGKSSGVFSFCLTRENLFNRSTRYACFHNLNIKHQYWLHDRFNHQLRYSANFMISKEQNPNRMKTLIEAELRKI